MCSPEINAKIFLTLIQPFILGTEAGTTPYKDLHAQNIILKSAISFLAQAKNGSSILWTVNNRRFLQVLHHQ